MTGSSLEKASDDEKDPILQRRAVRSFLPRPLTDEEVSHLVAAFQASPCAMGQADMMEGVVVRSAEARILVENAVSGACYGAPLLFVIATKRDDPSQFGVRDASVAAENIMVEAARLGLGSVYIMGGALKLASNLAATSSIGIDSDYIVRTIVPVGHIATPPKAVDRSHRYTVIQK